MTTTLEVLDSVLAAFNAHDLDRIMCHFAEDCVLEMPRGPQPWGQRYTGWSEVRNGLQARLAGIPDVHYGMRVTSSMATPVSRNGP